jgi:hypothetical protein
LASFAHLFPDGGPRNGDPPTGGRVTGVRGITLTLVGVVNLALGLFTFRNQAYPSLRGRGGEPRLVCSPTVECLVGLSPS